MSDDDWSDDAGGWDDDDNDNGDGWGDDNGGDDHDDDEELPAEIQVENLFYMAEDARHEQPADALQLVARCVEVARAAALTEQCLKAMTLRVELLVQGEHESEVYAAVDELQGVLSGSGYVRHQKEALLASVVDLVVSLGFPMPVQTAGEDEDDEQDDGVQGSGEIVARRVAVECLLPMLKRDVELQAMWFRQGNRMLWRVLRARRGDVHVPMVFELFDEMQAWLVSSSEVVEAFKVEHAGLQLLLVQSLAGVDDLSALPPQARGLEPPTVRRAKLVEVGPAVQNRDALAVLFLHDARDSLLDEARQEDATASAEAAFAIFQELGRTQDAVQALQYYLCVSAVCGTTSNPFYDQRFKVFEAHEAVAPFAQLRLALAQGNVDEFRTLLRDHPAFKADPLIEKLRYQLVHVKPARLSDDVPIWFRSVAPGKYEGERCPICLEDFGAESGVAVRLPRCGACYFHRDCVAEWIEQTKKCPTCSRFYGKMIGQCPPGTMNVSRSQSSLPGFSGCGTILLTFEFPGGVQGEEHPQPGQSYPPDSRQAHLPDNEEGNRVLKLFQIGWERRLLFRIGYSETRGRDGLIIFNGIHMKTSRSGGHGYPDATYLTRVTEEFSTKGVFDEDDEEEFEL